jgi:hypothetical protein
MESFRVVDFNAGGFNVLLASEFPDVSISIRNTEFVDGGLNVQCASDNDGVFAVVANTRISGASGSGINLNFVGCSDVGQIQIYSNTLANNSGRGIQITSSLSDSSKFRLANNIAWGNTLQDVFLSTTGSPGSPATARFFNNTFNSIVGTLGSGSTGNSNSNPQFINAGAGNFQIQTTSPAVNSGSNAYLVGAVDAAGQPRVVGSLTDRGAYETGVNDAISATLTVTNTNDSGLGSLRQAIVDANASTDFTFIRFNIPGACPRSIILQSDLPAISQGAQIDGYSQPGSSSNTLSSGDNAVRCVALSGQSGVSLGLNYNGNASSQFWVQGLIFSTFDEALRVNGGTNNLVRGNQFGGMQGALSFGANGVDVTLGAFSESSIVGGDAAAHRNVMASASSAAIQILAISSPFFVASNDNEIVGNLIGSYGVGTVNAGATRGVVVQTSVNTVRNNTIIYSLRDAVRLQRADGGGVNGNLISDNRIGLRDPFCTFLGCFSNDAGNGWSGVFVAGDDNQVLRNIVWNSGLLTTGHGIAVVSGLRNRISANSIYKNNVKGISLANYNGSDNDAVPANSSSANRGLNFPVILSAGGESRVGAVRGTLTTANGSYRVEVFSSALADDDPRGEGEIFHGATTVSISNGIIGVSNGSTSFTVSVGNVLTNFDLSGRQFVVTATDANGNTSEFSPRVSYQLCGLFKNGFENGTSACSAP